MEIKKIKQILLSLFVAVIFIASYASFGSSGLNVQPQTTTVVVPQTLYGSGDANGIVVGYGPILNISINCSSLDIRAMTNYNVSAILSNLTVNASNNLVNATYQIQDNYTVYTGKLNSYQLSNYITSNLISNDSKSCVSFRGQMFVLIPRNVSFFINNQKTTLNIPPNLRNHPIFAGIVPVNSIIPLRIAGIFTYDGQIYGNLSITKLGGS